MNKYKIFGKHGEVITEILADSYNVSYETRLVNFYRGMLCEKYNVAWFNVDVIAGFCKVEALSNGI